MRKSNKKFELPNQNDFVDTEENIKKTAGEFENKLRRLIRYNVQKQKNVFDLNQNEGLKNFIDFQKMKILNISKAGLKEQMKGYKSMKVSDFNKRVTNYEHLLHDEISKNISNESKMIEFRDKARSNKRNLDNKAFSKKLYDKMIAKKNYAQIDDPISYPTTGLIYLDLENSNKFEESIIKKKKKYPQFMEDYKLINEPLIIPNSDSINNKLLEDINNFEIPNTQKINVEGLKPLKKDVFKISKHIAKKIDKKYRQRIVVRQKKIPVLESGNLEENAQGNDEAPIVKYKNRSFESTGILGFYENNKGKGNKLMRTWNNISNNFRNGKRVIDYTKKLKTLFREIKKYTDYYNNKKGFSYFRETVRMYSKKHMKDLEKSLKIKPSKGLNRFRSLISFLRSRFCPKRKRINGQYEIKNKKDEWLKEKFNYPSMPKVMFEHYIYTSNLKYTDKIPKVPTKPSNMEEAQDAFMYAHNIIQATTGGSRPLDSWLNSLPTEEIEKMKEKRNELIKRLSDNREYGMYVKAMNMIKNNKASQKTMDFVNNLNEDVVESYNIRLSKKVKNK